MTLTDLDKRQLHAMHLKYLHMYSVTARTVHHRPTKDRMKWLARYHGACARTVRNLT